MTTRTHRAVRVSLPALIAGTLAVGALARPVVADAQTRDILCIQRYNAVAGKTVFDPTNAAQAAKGCQLVAVALTADWGARDLFGSAVSPRDVSATRDQTTASPGERTAAIEPVEAAGGSVAAVGTQKGAGAVAAIAINPSLFFVDPANVEEVSKWSRFSDVTVLVPASNLNGSNEDDATDGVDYIGIRWGLNINGFRQGTEVYRKAVAAYNQFLAASGVSTRRVRDLLLALPSDDGVESCIRALSTAQTLDDDAVSSITQVCGGPPIPIDPSSITGLQDAIRQARIQADARYFGLDLRADFGDLTLAGVDTLSGTSLFGGIGWGRRSVGSGNASTGIRANAGVRYWNLKDSTQSNVAVEGGLAFEAIRFYNFQRLSMVGGLDFQWRTSNSTSDDDTSIELRGSVNVPVFPTASVSLNLAAPLVGARRAPVLSIKANWRLLRSRTF
ncbi:hypothetical protein [Longimicrobium sp.]|uniref:hypothetical protein n=1 Tax=Longimicrobium sp. TaxID=2029185 RepID=UPI002C47335F|nr:hypothetical protein [Longimicrobium sp.]HSU16813.1 hypothetical protein [Longimicrobium sp.]